MSKVSVVLAGIGGYGKLVTDEILNKYKSLNMELRGVCDPFPEGNARLEEIKALGTKVYSDLEQFYSENTADLAVISTPIGFHTQHITTALRNGSNVLCEKPLCADENDIDLIISERDKAKKLVLIGYQWSYSNAINDLKNDISAGVFGKPKNLKTLVIWPRNADYFGRGTGWAGKIKTADGTLVYDSIANNAAAHYLHNMFYVLGGVANVSLSPNSFDATLLRANNIENFDTADIICHFDGFDARFTATHTTLETFHPSFNYEFENATVLFCNDKAPADDSAPGEYVPHDIVAYFKDGTVKHYGDPYGNQMYKFHVALDAVRNNDASLEKCGVETAAVHTRFINTLQHTTEIHNVKPSLKKLDGKMTYVDGLFDAVCEIYKTGTGSLKGFGE